jgi:hypothetical protein
MVRGFINGTQFIRFEEIRMAGVSGEPSGGQFYHLGTNDGPCGSCTTDHAILWERGTVGIGRVGALRTYSCYCNDRRY